MVMIAAVTPSLVLIRIGVGLGLFDIGRLTETGGQPRPVGPATRRVLQRRRRVCPRRAGAGSLDARALQSSALLEGFARGPGLITCLVAMVASILPILWLAGTVLVESRSPNPVYSVTFNNFSLAGWWTPAL